MQFFAQKKPLLVFLNNSSFSPFFQQYFFVLYAIQIKKIKQQQKQKHHRTPDKMGARTEGVGATKKTNI